MRITIRQSAIGMILASLVHLASAQTGGGGTAVPVYDSNTEDTVKAAANTISKAIENQNKLIGELMQAATAELADKERMSRTISEKRKNADTYSAASGAKAMTACGIRARAISARAGNVNVREISTELNNLSRIHNERERFAEPGELSAEGSAFRVIDQMRAYRKLRETNAVQEGSFVDPANRSLGVSRDNSGNSEYVYEAMRYNNLINPFPDSVQPGFDAPGQPIAGVRSNAKALVKSERLYEASSVMNRLIANRVALYDTNWSRSLFTIGERGTVLNRAALGSSAAQGYMANLEAINKFRALDDGWTEMIGATNNEVGLAREQALMSAGMLVNDQEVITLLREILKMVTLQYALHVEHYGKDDELAVH